MRNASVSISKAIAIILMVLAHASIPLWWQQYIYMFHMPLFFFFAGYCFKEKYLNTAWIFIKNKTKGIYWPFVKWGLLFLILHNIFYRLNIYNDEFGFNGNVSALYSMKEYLYHAFNIVTRMLDQEQLLGGYWFLKTLFWASLIGYCVIKIIKPLIIGGGILLIITWVFLVLGFQVPFFAIGPREFLAAFFFVIGYLYHISDIKIEQSKFILPFGIIVVAIGVEYWQCTMLSLTPIKLLPYSITAIIGTLSIFSISKIISKSQSLVKKSIEYIGDNTLPILTWHFLCFKLVSLLLISINDLPIQRLAEFPVIEEYALKGWWVAYFVVGIIFPILIHVVSVSVKSFNCKNYKF